MTSKKHTQMDHWAKLTVIQSSRKRKKKYIYPISYEKLATCVANK